MLVHIHLIVFETLDFAIPIEFDLRTDSLFQQLPSQLLQIFMIEMSWLDFGERFPERVPRCAVWRPQNAAY